MGKLKSTHLLFLKDMWTDHELLGCCSNCSNIHLLYRWCLWESRHSCIHFFLCFILLLRASLKCRIYLCNWNCCCLYSSCICRVSLFDLVFLCFTGTFVVWYLMFVLPLLRNNMFFLRTLFLHLKSHNLSCFMLCLHFLLWGCVIRFTLRLLLCSLLTQRSFCVMELLVVELNVQEVLLCCLFSLRNLGWSALRHFWRVFDRSLYSTFVC